MFASRFRQRDHFVDVITDTGTQTLRLRFADAVDEMEPAKGFLTHHSHWMSQDAIEGVERQDGKLFLRLNNNDIVPVSRTYRPALADAGILDEP